MATVTSEQLRMTKTVHGYEYLLIILIGQWIPNADVLRCVDKEMYMFS